MGIATLSGDGHVNRLLRNFLPRHDGFKIKNDVSVDRGPP